jgi:hypothetical protein
MRMWLGCCRGSTVRGVVGDEPELGRQDHAVAMAFQSAADEFLIGVRAVDFGGVDQIDAEVEGAVDGVDGSASSLPASVLAMGHAHGAEPDPGHIQLSQASGVHEVPI